MDKTLVTRSTGMLLLKLIENEDMYGYQMIEELARRSDDTFTLKAGTLYPMLHDLEADNRIRKNGGYRQGKEILQHNKGGPGGAFRQNQGVAGVFPRP